jgi:hypothetical protein
MKILSKHYYAFLFRVIIYDKIKIFYQQCNMFYCRFYIDFIVVQQSIRDKILVHNTEISYNKFLYLKYKNKNNHI